MNVRTQDIIARVVYYWRRIKPIRTNNKGKKAILVVRPDMIGDLVCTIPFLRSLRKDFPDYIITLVIDPSIYNMMELCPYVDEIVTYSKKAEKHKFMTTLKRSMKFVREQLPQHHYEYAFVPSYANPDSYNEAWISFYSRAKHRIAYSETVDMQKHKDYDGTYDMYFTNLCNNTKVSHEVESCLNLLKFIGKPIGNDSLELWTNAQDQQFVENLFQEYAVKKAAIKVVVNLSTSNTTKDWPVESFIKVCHKLYQNYQVEFLLIGAGKMAKEYADEFCAKISVAHNFVNQTTIRQTIEILRHSDLYLGGDTGPMHLAAACHLGGVAIYKTAKTCTGVKPFVWFAPWQSKIQIIAPEHPLPGCEVDCSKPHHCISQVTPAEVYSHMSKQIEALNHVK